jgi:hypothetical protein
MLGAKSLRAQTLSMIFITCEATLLAPWAGRCTCDCALRNLKASLVVHTPLGAGFHLTVSWLLEGTDIVWNMTEAALLSKIVGTC